jgi:hypothetical protein
MRILASLRTAVLLLSGALPLAAYAQIQIDVGAQADNAFSDGRTFAPSVDQAWGRAVASSLGGFAIFGEGTLSCPLGTCTPGPTVGDFSAAAARADATKMTVGVFARGAATSFLTEAIAEVSVRDTLAIASGGFGTMTFDIHIDLDLISASGSSDASYSFGITLGSGDERRGVFAFHAADAGGARTAQVFLNDATTVLDLPDIPSTFDRIVSVPVFGGTSVPIEVFASAHTDAGSGEEAFVDAFNSAWLGISGVSFTSANGYSYPGFTAAIPEPTPAVLLLAGLAMVLLGYRHRS